MANLLFRPAELLNELSALQGLAGRFLDRASPYKLEELTALSRRLIDPTGVRPPDDVFAVVPSFFGEIPAWKRAARSGRMTYDPPDQVAWKARISEAVLEAMPIGVREPAWSGERLRLDVAAVLPRGLRQRELGLDWCADDPDVDNVAKVVLDALQYRAPDRQGRGGRRAIVADDCRFVLAAPATLYAEPWGPPRLLVRIRVVRESVAAVLVGDGFFTADQLARVS